MKSLSSLFLALSFVLATPAWAEAVNINTADAATLQESLKGVGKARAEAIIEYRERYGPFEFVDDLTRVDGVGRMTLERNRDNISLK